MPQAFVDELNQYTEEEFSPVKEAVDSLIVSDPKGKLFFLDLYCIINNIEDRSKVVVQGRRYRQQYSEFMLLIFEKYQLSPKPIRMPGRRNSEGFAGIRINK